MKKEKLIETLKELSIGKENRSATAQLRDIFDDIEAALDAGVRRQAIWKALSQAGYQITPKNFESAIHRIRKERGDARKHTMRSTPKVVALSVMDATAPKTVQELMDDKPFEFPSRKKLIKPEGA